MRRNLAVIVVMELALASITAAADGTNGPRNGAAQSGPLQKRSQDQLQTSGANLDQKRTRLRDSLPETVQQAVQDMKQARERYQQQLQEKRKELTASTDEQRERLREQLRAVVQEQARDREQLRERLQALRESLPSHQQLMEQAREQVQQHDRRGD
jgi:chromosome segregation ATPase